MRAAADGRSVGWPLSLVEAVVASLIVVGHNVWRVIPNEVPILAVLGLLSFQLRNGGWAMMGLGPPSWLRTLVLALVVAVCLQLVSELVTEPLFRPFLRHSAHANPFAGTRDAGSVVRWLGLVWTFAAFGEETAYRGYLLGRVADLGGGSRAALLCGLAWSSLMFGFGHWYQGPAGVARTAVDGLILGTAYLLSGRNLWVAILAHGFSDTYAIALTASGLGS